MARWMSKFQVITYGVTRLCAKLAVVQGAGLVPTREEGPPGRIFDPSPHATVPAGKIGVAPLLVQPVCSVPGAGLKLAAAMLPFPCVHVPFTQSSAPVGTFPRPTEFPPEFMNAEKGTYSYSMLAPARTTVFWLPWTSHAIPTRGEKLLWSPL